MKRWWISVALAVLVAMPDARVSACDKPGHDAVREAARDAAREATREASRDAVRDAVREQLRAELRAAVALPPGVLMTPRAMLFVDGPEVPLEWVQWADEAATRRSRRPTVTDTVLRVGPGVTLALSNLIGDISVQVWDRSEVRIHAEHDRDDRVIADLKDGTLRLGVRARHPVPAEVEWDLTVPAWLPLDLSGMESDIVVTGMRAPVRVQSIRGDVNVSSCQGSVEVNSVEGEVHVSDVSGNVTAGSVNNVIRLVRVSGPVEVQSINGDIQFEKVVSSNVAASTMNGRVYYASPFRAHGRYAFSSHNGNLYVGLPTDQRLKVKVSSFNGQVESSVPVPAPAPAPGAERYNRGRAFYFTTGDAPDPPSAPEAPRTPRAPRAPRAPQAPELELESFGGLIQFASQEEVQRVLRLQRSLLDSSRTTLLRVQRELERARRHARPSEARPTPEAPAPTPHKR